MEPHSSPIKFYLNKHSYLDFVFNCCEKTCKNKKADELKKQLFDIIMPQLSATQKCEASNLVLGIICETKDAIIDAISKMDCIKIELNK